MPIFEAQHARNRRTIVVLAALGAEAQALTRLGKLEQELFEERLPQRAAVIAGHGSADSSNDGTNPLNAVQLPSVQVPSVQEVRNQEVQVIVVPTGVGKVAAAMHTQRAIDRYAPLGIAFVGVAGGLALDLKAMDIVIASDCVQWDVDLSAFGAPLGTLNDGRRFLHTDSEGAALAMRSAQTLGVPARLGRIASGDSFLADPERAAWIRNTFEADAVEMEGAACAQVALDNNVPLLLIRVISDGASAEAAGSFEHFLEAAATRAALLTEHVLPIWSTRLQVQPSA